MLWTRTSARFTSARTALRPSSCLRSSTMLRLLRLVCRNIAPMPMFRAGRMKRVESPCGGSTLTTSAPNSPRICVAYGPMTTVVRSRTRTPASGPRQMSLLKILFWLDSSELGELRPMRDLGLDEAAELSRTHRGGVDADAGVLFLHL